MGTYSCSRCVPHAHRCGLRLSHVPAETYFQRFYQALTSANPPTPPYSSSTRFAALPAGPGNAKSHAEGDSGTAVTTFRVSMKDKKIIDEVHYKGWTVRLADWLHLSNPDDASRPIIGQVFKCFVSEEA